MIDPVAGVEASSLEEASAETAVSADGPAGLAEEYLRCLIAPDARGARQLAQRALDSGVPAAALYLHVVTPAMHEIGRLWETAQITVAQEHLSTQISHPAGHTLMGWRVTSNPGTPLRQARPGVSSRNCARRFGVRSTLPTSAARGS